MPDHVHLLFRLGNRLALDRVIAKWRASVRRLLVDLNWQPNYFEHLLRPFEDAESYAWYIFMNPYHAQLIGLNDSWAGWWTDTLVSWRFLSDVLPVLRPLPEWLDMFEGVAHTLATGEM